MGKAKGKMFRISGKILSSAPAREKALLSSD
jgi:hypothetical protein